MLGVVVDIIATDLDVVDVGMDEIKIDLGILYNKGKICFHRVLYMEAALKLMNLL